MKTEPNDSAHPTSQHSDGYSVYTNGLTKREYFSAMAMQGYCAGILSNTVIATAVDKESQSLGITNHEYIASEACCAADALITALNQPTL